MTLDLSGETYGELTVLRKSGREYSGGTYRTLYECKCSCGTICIKRGGDLRKKAVRTCGKCQWHIKHKDAYISWTSMRQRCLDKYNKDYKNYGGRGITLTPEWNNFASFFKDMGDPPLDDLSGERLTLDRIDNNGNYTKDNCRWATRSQQQNNKGRQIRFKN